MVKNSEWCSLEDYSGLLGAELEGMTLYHSVEWLMALRSGFGSEIRGMKTTGAGGELLATTPFVQIRKGPFGLLGSPLSGMYTEYAGPLFVPGLSIEERAAVLASQHDLVLRSGHYIEWGARGDRGEVSWGAVLEQLGYEHVLRSSILVDLLGGQQKVWEGFESRARNMVRKAEKSGVEVRTVAMTEEWVEAYYRMLQATFERQGRIAPHPLSFFRALAGVRQCVAVSAGYEGRNIANAIFLVDRGRMLYLSGTANAEGMKLAANSLIQWHAIREAIAANVTEYDMGGTGVAAIDKFKHSFGGREIRHHRWAYRSRLFGLAEPLALWAARKGWLRVGGH